MADLFSGSKPQRKPRKPSLEDRTGERYPHNGYLRKGVDPRLREYLINLKVAGSGVEHEALLWVICAGVWWLTGEQAREVAEILGKVLESEV